MHSHVSMEESWILPLLLSDMSFTHAFSRGGFMARNLSHWENKGHYSPFQVLQKSPTTLHVLKYKLSGKKAGVAQ